MPMISNPPIGATAYSRAGSACTVAEVGDNRVLLNCPSGSVRVPLSAIVRWEIPKPTPTSTPPPIKTNPQPFQLGDPLEVYFPHVDQWRRGFRYLEPHRNPEKCWLTDSQGIEHGSRLEWVRRAKR
jgi:hypothetical protein